MNLKIRVTPRSSKNEVKVEGEIVRVWVNASPTDGQANDAVIALLARRLDVTKSRLALVSGHAGRDKTVSVDGLSFEEILAKLG